MSLIPESSPTMVTLNVGGTLFQTTLETLNKCPPNSLLSPTTLPSSSSLSSSSNITVPFFDRDPQLFSTILSFLRHRLLPPISQTLVSEFHFYGLESLLFDHFSNSSRFDPYLLQRFGILPLNGRDSPNAVSTTSFGGVFVAHGSKLTSFDWSLTKKSTILTEFVAVDSLLALSPSVVAAGAVDFSGLQIIDVENGVVKDRLNWENSTRSSSNVQGLGCSDEYLFVSFESSRRNSNAIVVYDLLGEFRPVFEVARNEIYGAEFDCGTIPATKLSWVSGRNLLVASGSHSGPTGVLGSIKLWDVRSGDVVWEMQDKVDCFSDVGVSSSLSGVFKIGVNSGEMFFIDLRKLGRESEWVCLGNKSKSMSGKKAGLGCRVECHGSSVFVSKGGEVELWSEIVLNKAMSGEAVLDERVFRSNLMGRAKDMGGNKITNLRFGGTKMFVTRKDQQLVEVWDSSVRGLDHFST